MLRRATTAAGMLPATTAAGMLTTTSRRLLLVRTPQLAGRRSRRYRMRLTRTRRLVSRSRALRRMSSVPRLARWCDPAGWRAGWSDLAESHHRWSANGTSGPTVRTACHPPRLAKPASGWAARVDRIGVSPGWPAYPSRVRLRSSIPGTQRSRRHGKPPIGRLPEHGSCAVRRDHHVRRRPDCSRRNSRDCIRLCYARCTSCGCIPPHHHASWGP